MLVAFVLTRRGGRYCERRGPPDIGDGIFSFLFSFFRMPAAVGLVLPSWCRVSRVYRCMMLLGLAT